MALKLIQGSPASCMSFDVLTVCPSPRPESAAPAVTAPAAVSLGSGTSLKTRSRRGVHRPQNHLAWLELQLVLFPEVRCGG